MCGRSADDNKAGAGWKPLTSARPPPRNSPWAKAAAATAILAGAEASKGSSRISGGRAASASASRRRGPAGRLGQSAQGACAASDSRPARSRAAARWGRATIPRLRTSIRPARPAGGLRHELAGSDGEVRAVVGNQHGPGPDQPSARSDFPAPLGPSSSTPASFGAPNAAPARSSTTQLAWMFVPISAPHGRAAVRRRSALRPIG